MNKAELGAAWRLRLSRVGIAYVVLVVVWLVTSLLISGFATLDHVYYILQIGSFLGIIAAGQTLVVIMAGIDLSVSGAVTLAAVVASQFLAAGYGVTIAAAAALLASAAVGLVNAGGIVLLGVSPMVMTMAVVSIIEGVLLILTNGTPPAGKSPILNLLASGRLVGGVPNSVLIWIAVTLFVVWLLNYSRFGRYAYAIGTNPTAAEYSGVPIGFANVLFYVLCSVLAGLSGLLLLGYTGNPYLTMGTPYQLSSIAAVVLGGTSILGGRGSYLGTIAGALLLTVIISVLTVFNMSEAGRQVIQGALIIALLLVYGRDSK